MQRNWKAASFRVLVFLLLFCGIEFVTIGVGKLAGGVAADIVFYLGVAVGAVAYPGLVRKGGTWTRN